MLYDNKENVKDIDELLFSLNLGHLYEFVVTRFSGFMGD